MKTLLPISAALFLLPLAACGEKKAEEVAPGAAALYLDNMSAHMAAANAAHANASAAEAPPAPGTPDYATGQAPVFSREPVAPRKP